MREKLIKYFLQENKKINLSAIRNEKLVMEKHINDSLELNKILKIKKGKSICDIGTGWWFPLLPLAMTNPDDNFVWIDARRKKVDAVNSIIEKIWLENVECKWSRIEDFEEKFDFITARAVWYTDKLLKWSYDLLKKWWYFVFYKKDDKEEYEMLKKLCKKYKLRIEKKHKYKLFDEDIQRIIYLIKKI